MNKLLQKINDFIIVNCITIEYNPPKGHVTKQSPTLIKYELDNGMEIGIGLNHETKAAYVEFKHKTKRWDVLNIFSIGDLSSFFNTMYFVFKIRTFNPTSITFVGAESRRVGIYMDIIRKNFPDIVVERETVGIFTKLNISKK